MTRHQLISYLSEVLGLCGCSDNDQSVRFLFDLLEAGEMRGAGMTAESDATIDDILPEGDCLERNLPVYWMTAGGLIEHGYTLTSYTLSEIGVRVLEALRTYGTGDDLWADDAPPVVPIGEPERVWN